MRMLLTIMMLAGVCAAETVSTEDLLRMARTREAGLEPGGIMAFNAAFDRPEEFSRVLSWIGSYMALQRSAVHPEGGAEYPTMVRREAKRNIRVWIQDGPRTSMWRPVIGRPRISAWRMR